MHLSPTTLPQRMIVYMIALGAMLSSGLAWSTNYYVRPNSSTYGSGDGSSWSNAFSGLPASGSTVWGTGTNQIGPGDTIYVAGGTYTKQWVVGCGGSAESSRLTIRRATAANHGTDTGWASSMDSQVVVSNVGVVMAAKHFVTLEGSVTDGIKVTVPDTGNSSIRFIGVDLGPGNTNYSHNVTLRNVEIAGPGRQKDGETRGLQNADGNNLLIEYCRIHDIGSALYIGGKGTIVQYSTIHDIDAAGYPVDVHENVCFITGGSGLIFRYNTVRNTTAVGVFTRYGGDYTEVYGNVFEKSAQAVIVDDRGGKTGIKVYDNTFISCYVPIRYLPGAVDGIVRNNIIFSVSGDGSVGPNYQTASHDYNWYTGTNYGEAHGVNGGTVDPFVSRSTKNYRLKSGVTPINTGVALASAYSKDMDGKTRGSDGKWDIGAFEYGGSTSPSPTPTPTPTPAPTATPTPTPTPTATPSSVIARVNCGGSAYTDASGNVWSADKGYNTGTSYKTTATIGNTTMVPLYQSERYDVGASPELTYSFAVPASGSYRVRLHFAEIYYSSTGQRKFDVLLEGKTVLSYFDIVAKVGAKKAYVAQFDTTVSDGQLTISFIHRVQNPKISAIEIIKL